jgi:hypothetical protein
MILFKKGYLPTSEQYLPNSGGIFTNIWRNIYQHLSGKWFPTKDCSVFETSAAIYQSTFWRSEASLTPLWEPQLSDQSNVCLFKECYQKHTNQPINVKLRFVPFPKHSPTEHSKLMPIRNRGRLSKLSPK